MRCQVSKGLVENAGSYYVVMHGRLRWFRHMEHNSGQDCVSTSGNIDVMG